MLTRTRANCRNRDWRTELANKVGGGTRDFFDEIVATILWLYFVVPACEFVIDLVQMLSRTWRRRKGDGYLLLLCEAVDLRILAEAAPTKIVTFDQDRWGRVRPHFLCSSSLDFNPTGGDPVMRKNCNGKRLWQQPTDERFDLRSARRYC